MGRLLIRGRGGGGWSFGLVIWICCRGGGGRRGGRRGRGRIRVEEVVEVGVRMGGREGGGRKEPELGWLGLGVM